MTPDGRVLDAEPFTIASNLSALGSGLATDGTITLVTWAHLREIRGARVNSDGVVLDPGGFVISFSPTVPPPGRSLDYGSPDVAYGNGTFFIVWTERENQPCPPGENCRIWSSTRAQRILGARVSPEGVLLDPFSTIVSDSGQDLLFYEIPRISVGGETIAVIWQRSSHPAGVGWRTMAGLFTTAWQRLVQRDLGLGYARQIIFDGHNFVIPGAYFREVFAQWTLGVVRLSLAGNIFGVDENIPLLLLQPPVAAGADERLLLVYRRIDPDLGSVASIFARFLELPEAPRRRGVRR